jgi:trimeric autotransporter adhesin
MTAVRSAIVLALIVVSVLGSSVFAADPPTPASPAASPPARLAPVAGYWDDRFDIAFYERWGPSSGYVINDALIFNGDLYVGGVFDDYNTSNAAHSLVTIARWDGRKWSNVAKWTSNYNAVIYAMEVHNNSLYVAGTFTTAGGVPATNIARWDGTSWHALGSGLSGASNRVLALASWNGDLYAAGSFSSAGGVPVDNIARWDGAGWHAVGEGLTDDTNGGITGLALEATPQGLYAGGAFNRSGAQAMQTLARWDGAQWSAAIPGLTGIVFSMDWHNGAIYAGGRFALSSAPAQTHNTLRWDGAQTQLMTAGPDPQSVVRAVRSVDGELYAGLATALYRWNGGAWESFGPPFKPSASSPAPVLGMDIISYDGQLHLVGSMESASTTRLAKYAMALNGNEWAGLGQGALARTYESVGGLSGGPMVSGVAVINEDFYIAADTIKAGGQVMGNLVRWDGAAWTDVSVGPPNAQATAILAVGSTLYAAGSGYDPALGRNSNFIARRDGGVWTTLANDFDGRVETLAWSDGVLYAGGRFTAIGATPARGVARWDGTAWSGLGGGLLYNVRALAVANGTVYAAGATNATNTSYPDTIARWSSGAWTVIAAATTYALEIGPDGDLYAGGEFTTIGGVPADSIARWRNGTWGPLGNGNATPSGIVYALGFAPDGTLYAGGHFKLAGSQVATNIARYDGLLWSAFGVLEGIAGLSNPGAVRDLEVTAQGVYAGGDIFWADGRYSESVAIWRPGAPPLAVADTASAIRGQSVDIAVLGNDSDADQDTLTITGVTTPSQGVVELVDGMVRYTPAGNYVGTDSFGYTISDGRGGTDSATVTVTVSAPLTSIFLPLIVK